MQDKIFGTWDVLMVAIVMRSLLPGNVAPHSKILLPSGNTHLIIPDSLLACSAWVYTQPTPGKEKLCLKLVGEEH